VTVTVPGNLRDIHNCRLCSKTRAIGGARDGRRVRRLGLDFHLSRCCQNAYTMTVTATLTATVIATLILRPCL
jgi:hypothetical protein